MNLNFTVSLADIAIGLDVSGNSESEREEIMDFLVSVDEDMADSDFTCNLIYRLAEDLSQDTEAHDSETVTIPDGFGDKRVTFSQLYEGLSYLDEDKLIALLANAMKVSRERDAEAARNAAPCDVCGHPWGAHNYVCLPGLTGSCHACTEEAKGAKSAVCVCGHILNYHGSLKRSSACTLSSIKDQMGAIPCPCEGFEEKA